MSSKYLVGFGNENNEPCRAQEAIYHFWWAPQDELEKITLSRAISPEKVLSFSRLTTQGDFAAVQIYRDLTRGDGSILSRTERVRLLLLRISDQAMRQIRPPPGMDFLNYFLSDEHLYVVFHTSIDVNPNLYGAAKEIIRYDLKKFDEIGIPHTGEFD